ncbi:hypothetical protein ACF06X_05885 [Streptomyces sp. NPDC015346]|uniref:hypothetical protein n=1 Tax=Streptomyces sp. NPDC015346 TaxID=3364954 RepID=UPI0036F8CA48
MRALPRRAAALASVAALLAGVAVAAEVRAAPAPPQDPVAPVAPVAVEPENFGASCRTDVEGSRVTAYCHNPYPGTDRVRLHVECDRWWDVDTDSAPVDVAPTAYVRLYGRCWKEVRSAWLTHEPADAPPGAPGEPPSEASEASEASEVSEVSEASEGSDVAEPAIPAPGP